MRLFGYDISRGEARKGESPAVEERIITSVTGMERPGSSLLQLIGVTSASLPTVTIESALSVPAVSAAVSFLSGSMANLPLHAYRAKKGGSERLKDGVQRLMNEAPNPEWTSFGMRKYLWQQVFTGGRGLAWIERQGPKIVAIWPMDPGETQINRLGGRKFYNYGGKRYEAADVIDIPFMLKIDQLGSYSPITMGAKAIQLAIAMNDYASGFFAGGGVPPLALVGPMPAGPEAIKRAQADIKRSVDAAKANGNPILPIPAGYELKPVGFDPDKGQMTEARRFQIEEFARIWNLPPVFLQDLTHGTFSNTEQQDLHLVKHLIAQWAKAFEEECNLKLFGSRPGGLYVEHNLDGLMRGDFKSRIEGLARGVQSAILTPDEARALENRAPMPEGDRLYIQGATVPLGSQPVTNNGGANDPGNSDANPSG